MNTPKKSSPIAKVRTGKAGRPADVRKLAMSAIAMSILTGHAAYPVIPKAVPKRVMKSWAGFLADKICDEITNAGLRIVPARFLSEIAVFSGEPVAADDPSLPKPTTDE